MKASLEDQAMSHGLCATQTLLNTYQDEKLILFPLSQLIGIAFPFG